MIEDIDLWLAEEMLKAEREKYEEVIKKAAEKQFWQKLGLEVVE